MSDEIQKIIAQNDKLLTLFAEHHEMKSMLQIVLDTFGRTDGVMVTTQTKQKVLDYIRELVGRVEHE